MKPSLKGNGLIIVIILAFSVIIPTIFLIDWVDKNLTNPRIWKDMTCEEMKKFAMTFEDEKLNDFQRVKFHEDLSLCLKD